VAQVTDATTTTFALDVMGLPEVIASRNVRTASEDNAYLHLPGLTLTENTADTLRYLLSDGLGSIRQVVDAAGVVVGYKNNFFLLVNRLIRINPPCSGRCGQLDRQEWRQLANQQEHNRGYSQPASTLGRK